MLIAGLVPVGFLAFSMQYGMMNPIAGEGTVQSGENVGTVSEFDLRISLRSMRTWLIICLILKISGIFLMWRQSRIMRSIWNMWRWLIHCCRCRRSITKEIQRHYIIFWQYRSATWRYTSSNVGMRRILVVFQVEWGNINAVEHHSRCEINQSLPVGNSMTMIRSKRCWRCVWIMKKFLNPFMSQLTDNTGGMIPGW